MSNPRWWGPLLALTLFGCATPAQPTAPSAPDDRAEPASRRLLQFDVGPGRYSDDGRGRYDDRGRYGDRDRRSGYGRQGYVLRPIRTYSSSDYARTSAYDAVDGNTDTQWANAGYQRGYGWLMLEFARNVDIESVDIKVGQLPRGVRYRFEVSDDGRNWTPVTRTFSSSTWQLENHYIGAHGRFLRVNFRNSSRNPVARFSIFELIVYGPEGWRGQGHRFRDFANRTVYEPL